MFEAEFALLPSNHFCDHWQVYILCIFHILSLLWLSHLLERFPWMLALGYISLEQGGVLVGFSFSWLAPRSLVWDKHYRISTHNTNSIFKLIKSWRTPNRRMLVHIHKLQPTFMIVAITKRYFFLMLHISSLRELSRSLTILTSAREDSTPSTTSSIIANFLARISMIFSEILLIPIR